MGNAAVGHKSRETKPNPGGYLVNIILVIIGAALCAWGGRSFADVEGIDGENYNGGIWALIFSTGAGTLLFGLAQLAMKASRARS